MIKIGNRHRKSTFIFVLGIAAIFICISNRTACAGARKTAPDGTGNLFYDQSGSGYIQIGSVQIAWGKTSVSDSKDRKRTQKINFPSPFVEIPAVTLGSQQTGAIRFSPYIASVTRGYFTIAAGSPNINIISWIAIGKWRQ